MNATVTAAPTSNATRCCAGAPWAARHPGGGSGLAVLQRSGVAAWLRAGETITPRPPAPASRRAHRRGGDELVGALATMALACLGSG